MFKLHIRTNRLTDGSETFDVVLCDLESANAEKSRAVMDFQAVTFRDALQFMACMEQAISAFTNDAVVTVL